RREIVLAAQQLAQAVAAGELRAEQIDERQLSQALFTAGLPDPDLLIRPSGEQRLSNFLLWQCAYSEFIFSPVLWPDFSEADFEAAVEEYGRRTRRFGGVEPAKSKKQIGSKPC
ncbi:MAG: isoprenyl transferase, partial [Lentisphaerae bacterium]|nr:isoprenyl transferase [Lentisphaerota bacterium]